MPPFQTNLLALRFDDFDDLQATIRAWDLDFRQLKPGPFSGALLQLSSPGFQLSLARFGGTLEQRGSPPPDAFTIAVPTHRCSPFRWRGHRMAPGKLAVFRPGSELDAVSSPGFEVLILSMTENELERAAERAGRTGVRDALTRSETMAVPHDLLRHLRRTCTSILERAADGDGSPSGPLGSLPEALFSCLDAGRGTDGVRPAAVRRRRIIEEAHALLSRRVREPVTVRHLCRTLSVNERTLRRAFRERFGISPKSYLTAIRLVGARRELRAASPRSARVAAIARSWGFPHPGAFSVTYRRQFGESPSETLRMQYNPQHLMG